MGKVFIVHFQPLEKYPPVMNLIRHMGRQKTGANEVHVISTEADSDKKLLEAPGITIHRIGKWKQAWSRWQRLVFYAGFAWKALKMLRTHQPDKVLYYETLSAGAPFFYKQWVNPKSSLYIHYHEYTSPEEYKNGMFISRWLHQLEKRVYKNTAWVSHTNDSRINLFIKDLGSKAPEHLMAVPNFPSESWKPVNTKKDNAQKEKTGFVYVGALSLETMYVESFARFIYDNPEKYYWDIYSDNYPKEVLVFFENLQAPNIRFKGSIEYDLLPSVLPNYDIGVILYKGHIPNYIYNAPNKLFEYLACELDAWFPQEMNGCYPYITNKAFPAVLKVDFGALDKVEVMPGKYKEDYQPVSNGFYYENHIAVLTNQLLQNEDQ